MKPDTSVTPQAADSSTSWSFTAAPPPTRVQRYDGTDQDDTFRLFAEDARRAARAGYEAVSHTWDADTLLVTYKFIGVPPKSGARWSGLSLPGLGTMIGGALVALGAILPWATVIGADGLAVTRTGVEGIDGLATIVVGLGIAILGRTMVRGGNLGRAPMALTASALTFVFIVADYFEIIQSGGTTSVGMFITTVGAVFATAASLRIANLRMRLSARRS